MSRDMHARRDLEQDLRQALEDDLLELHYQPLVDAGSRAIVGMEALLRWTHPTRGAIGPADFIPVAEQSGLILDLGRWVLHRACRDAASWPVPVSVAVNVSPAQLHKRTLVPDVTAALMASGLPPARLELEITEGVLISDTDYTLRALTELKARGIRVSMDDFGTGYSSLSYLRTFPFDKLKIDRSFVQGAEDDGDSTAIIRAVASLGQSLGMTTVAEGVETDAQLAALQREGCHQLQGYLISKPQPASAIARLLQAPVPPVPPQRRLQEELPCSSVSSTSAAPRPASG
jgi:EAL domain-containing protein (putative c-di-GMP-specific phosphodiesterase class I)